MQKRRLRVWIWVGFSAIALVVGAAWLITELYWDMPQAAATLDREWERAERNGFPLVASQLVPPERIPKRDAAAALLELGEELNRIDRQDRIERSLAEAVPKSDWRSADRALQAFGPALGRASEIAGADGAHFEKDWEMSIHVLFPELAQIKKIVKVLCFRAEVRAHRGDVEGAVADLAVSRKIAEFVADNPTLIGSLVSIALIAIHDRSVERIAGTLRGDRAGLARLARYLARPPERLDFRYALRGEVYMAVSFFRNFGLMGGMRALELNEDVQAPPAPDPRKLVREGQPRGLQERARLARSLRMWNDWHDRVEGVTDPVELAAGLKNMETIAETERRASYDHLKVFTPVFSQAAAAFKRRDADFLVVRAFVQVMEFEARAGRFPRSLAEAGAGSWKDPFSGKPLHYRTDGNIAKVWSVAENGKDDGGRPRRGGDLDYDLVAVYPRTED